MSIAGAKAFINVASGHADGAAGAVQNAIERLNDVNAALQHASDEVDQCRSALAAAIQEAGGPTMNVWQMGLRLEERIHDCIRTMLEATRLIENFPGECSLFNDEATVAIEQLGA